MAPADEARVHADERDEGAGRHQHREDLEGQECRQQQGRDAGHAGRRDRRLRRGAHPRQRRGQHAIPRQGHQGARLAREVHHDAGRQAHDCCERDDDTHDGHPRVAEGRGQRRVRTQPQRRRHHRDGHRDERVDHGGDAYAEQHAEGHVPLRLPHLLRDRDDGVEADVAVEDEDRGGDDPANAVGREGRGTGAPVGGRAGVPGGHDDD
mmetsp:Transcript_21382/g.63790  ORF Transcript_21382/g.63790 Transcript_21382/m.63790 type:complete len:208 (+) Transcript_21382:440-1063(+)